MGSCKLNYCIRTNKKRKSGTIPAGCCCSWQKPRRNNPRMYRQDHSRLHNRINRIIVNQGRPFSGWPFSFLFYYCYRDPAAVLAYSTIIYSINYYPVAVLACWRPDNNTIYILSFQRLFETIYLIDY